MPRTDEHPRRPEQPVISTPRDPGGVEETHPAFGTAVVTRGSGSAVALFQSDVLHQQTITLSIRRATRIRDLNRDWVHPEREELIEVEMSLAQWGALVSSQGIGSGVPVTIRRTQNDPFVPELPYQPRLKTSLDEVKATVGKLFSRAKETLAAVEDAVEGKQGVRAVRDALRLHGHVLDGAARNAAFAVQSMTEAGEHVTSQVRADIEAQILSAGRLVDSGAEIAAPEIRFAELEAAQSDDIG